MGLVICINSELKVSSPQSTLHTAAINDLAISQAVARDFLLGLQLVFRGRWTNTAFKQSHHFAAVF